MSNNSMNPETTVEQLSATEHTHIPPTEDPSSSNSFAFDRWLARKILESVGNPRLAVVLWDGSKVASSSDPPAARIVIKDRMSLWRFLLDSSVAFGDGYASGRVDVLGDLACMLEAAFRASAGKAGSWGTWIQDRLRFTNPLSRAKRNIYHHYDIGNDFYQLWLDEKMLYTCAYFPDPTMSLEQAQVSKMDHVCRKLRLKPGDSVVEAGCGWGALAMHMARQYGVKVRAYNISHEQIVYARQRAQREGLADRVEFVEDDFRNITGQFDAFVSVGMLEHVHRRNYHRLGAVIRNSLKPTGRGLIHSIGRIAPTPTDSWLRRRIFPGAYIPALSEIMTIFEPHNFAVFDVENIGFHYARTLAHWLERFDRVSDQIERKYDSKFVRTWRLYLVSSMASFQAGVMQLFQVVFTPGGNNDVPSSRAHLYHT